MQGDRNIDGETAQRGKLSIEKRYSCASSCCDIAPSGKLSSHDEGARMGHSSRHIENSLKPKHESGKEKINLVK